MKASFIVPAHNEEAGIGQTLNSIRQSMTELGGSHEVIVADDASTDATAAIAREHGARVVPVKLRQISAVRNAGAKVATGDVFVFVDADTVVNQKLLQAAFDALRKGCVGGSARLAFDARLPFWGRAMFALFSIPYYAANLGAGCFFFVKAEVFRAVNGFPTEYFAGEETLLSVRLKKQGTFRLLREKVVTSARKFRLYSCWEILHGCFAILFGGDRSVRSRKMLGMWYDGRRETKPHPGSSHASPLIK
jgi:glycosyltransferase involved in cell wall biosynthesis